MTPRAIMRALGLNVFAVLLALAAALALLSLLKTAGVLTPGALLTLLTERYESFLAWVLWPIEPFLKDAAAAVAPDATLGALWRDVFALFAAIALAFAAPVSRHRGTQPGIVSGAIGLAAAAAAAIGLDLYAGEEPIVPVALAALLMIFAGVRLVRAYAAAPAEEEGGERAYWRDARAAIEGNWTVLGAGLLAGAIAGADASAYSSTIATWFWWTS